MKENRAQKWNQRYVVKEFSTKTLNRNSTMKGQSQINGVKTTEYLMEDKKELPTPIIHFTKKKIEMA